MNRHSMRNPIFLLGLLVLVAVAFLIPEDPAWATHSETALGEMEGRTAPVSRRKCVGGPNVGQLCNEDADCAPSICQDRNVYNLTVAVKFNASAAQLTIIQNVMNSFAASLFDATDGQAQIGQLTIVNNAVGTGGDIWVQTGSGLSANSGHYGTGGKIYAGFNTLQFGTNPGEGLAHEFAHLVFDTRDEYEARAAGCGAVTGGAQCPTDPGEERCIMDQGGTGVMSTEFCWAGNHEPALVTEQSRCRSNRSCWEQIGHSWPNTYLVPAGAPDPGTGGNAIDPVVYFTPSSAARIVLVLDNSGSMSAESPSRMDRLKSAALDFVSIAENGTELGIVSFTDTATDQVAIAALGANRVAYTTAINGLTPTFRTNIGDGLQHAKDMIAVAGGVTANTAIVLMTDGINNEPGPNPAANLQSKIDMLLMQGIPVLVTCTGDDLGLNSQCQEIAAGTGGTYVDSSDAADMPEAFAQFHELIVGGQLGASKTGPLQKVDSFLFMVEPGAVGAAATLQWNNRGTEAALLVTGPLGTTFQGIGMELGQFVRIPSPPEPGDYMVEIIPLSPNTPDTYVAQAFVKNQAIGITQAPRFQVVESGEQMVVYVHPNYLAPITNVTVSGHVTKPDGTMVAVQLFDNGRDATDTGDDVAEDGVYTQTFTDTKMPGAYSWHLVVDATNAVLGNHSEDIQDVVPVPYVRELNFSATVNDRIGSQICVGSGFGEPGQTVKVPITLDNADGVAGFQVDVTYNPSILLPGTVSLGADTTAAGNWSVSSAQIAPGVLRVLGASNPPAGLPAGPAEVALAEFTIPAGVPMGSTQLGVRNCILSDKLGLAIPCQLCPEPGRVTIRPASTFSFRPIGQPVGVDRFDPLPFLVGVEAINSFGAVATGYNGTAGMAIPSGLCASTLQPNALGFAGGAGSGFFQARCCMDPILPNTTLNLTVEASDPSISIMGTSTPFLGVAKGDLDASNNVDVLDVIRTTRLSLLQPVAIPPPFSFQVWASDMLDPACAPDGTTNVLDVVRVTNKALNLPPLCACAGRLNGTGPGQLAVMALGGPIRFGIEKTGNREFLIRVEGAGDLAGFQFDLRGAGPKAVAVLEGLTTGGNWILASNFERGVLRVLAHSSTATGVGGDGPVIRIRNAGSPQLSGIIASDSRGREVAVRE